MNSSPEGDRLFNQTVVTVFVALFVYLIVYALGHGNTVAASLSMVGAFVSLIWMFSTS